MFTCYHCGYSMVAERQKGHVYYRCHTTDCPTTCIREEELEAAILEAFSPLLFSNQERAHLQQLVSEFKADWTDDRESVQQAHELRLAKLETRLARLTDVFLDGTIEKQLFQERKTALLTERREIEEILSDFEAGKEQVPQQIAKFLELAGSAWLTYRSGLPDEKREILETVTSNREIAGKNVVIELQTPFDLVAERRQDSNGGPCRDRSRTLTVILAQLSKFFGQESGN